MCENSQLDRPWNNERLFDLHWICIFVQLCLHCPSGNIHCSLLSLMENKYAHMQVFGPWTRAWRSKTKIHCFGSWFIWQRRHPYLFIPLYFNLKNDSYYIRWKSLPKELLGLGVTFTFAYILCVLSNCFLVGLKRDWSIICSEAAINLVNFVVKDAFLALVHLYILHAKCKHLVW